MRVSQGEQSRITTTTTRERVLYTGKFIEYTSSESKEDDVDTKGNQSTSSQQQTAHNSGSRDEGHLTNNTGSDTVPELEARLNQQTTTAV